jgi:DNA adenine methylase
MEFDLLPILKWPGSKRWFVKYLNEYLPENYNTYIEPFFGGGSVFFALEPKKAVLSDINKELITTYRLVRDEWASVKEYLQELEMKHDEKMYYQVRSLEPETNFDVAVRMMYLNRTCFNGIYRVNEKGKFNVPIGSFRNIIKDTDDFEGVSKALKKAKLVCSDFEKIIDAATKNDLIFADPPYTVSHNFNGFIGYNEKLFSWDDQIRLADSLERAAKRGVNIIATNADHYSVRKLYKERGFKLKTVSRYSSIAAKKESRNQYKELIILS